MGISELLIMMILNAGSATKLLLEHSDEDKVHFSSMHLVIWKNYYSFALTILLNHRVNTLNCV